MTLKYAVCVFPNESVAVMLCWPLVDAGTVIVTENDPPGLVCPYDPPREFPSYDSVIEDEGA